MSNAARFVSLALALTFLAGCPKPNEMEAYRPVEKDYNKPLPPGQLALRKIPLSRYPDFSAGYDNRAQLDDAIRNSLAYLSKPSSQRYFPYGDITHARAIASLQAFLTLINSVSSGKELNQIIRRDYDVYQSVGFDERGGVYFTGYYCPIFEGRKQADSIFRYPLYGLPPDLVKDEEGRALGRRRPDGGMAPYYTRREIEEGRVLEGTEIAWLKDPFEAYVVTVQGSAKLRLQDGSLYELGYAANNGHEYKSVGQAMLKAKVIGSKDLSLQGMIRYFRSHPDHVRRFCWINDRYVFFKESPGGPFGSLNTPVIPYRTIATDKDVFPRACLTFIKTDVPVAYENKIRTVPYSGFALDQDTGGAIRAAGRCDIFMGIGPGAEAIAGRVGSEGALYYLFVKDGTSSQAGSNAPANRRLTADGR